jgi:hypothetical protein
MPANLSFSEMLLDAEKRSVNVAFGRLLFFSKGRFVQAAVEAQSFDEHRKDRVNVFYYRVAGDSDALSISPPSTTGLDWTVGNREEGWPPSETY